MVSLTGRTARRLLGSARRLQSRSVVRVAAARMKFDIDIVEYGNCTAEPIPPLTAWVWQYDRGDGLTANEVVGRLPTGGVVSRSETIPKGIESIASLWKSQWQCPCLVSSSEDGRDTVCQQANGCLHVLTYAIDVACSRMLVSDIRAEQTYQRLYAVLEPASQLELFVLVTHCTFAAEPA